MVDDYVDEVRQSLRLAFRIQESRNLVPCPQKISLEDDGEQETSVDAGEDGDVEEGGWTGHRNALLVTSGESEPTTRMETSEEDLKQVDDDSPSGDDQVQTVTSGDVIEPRKTLSPEIRRAHV